MDLKALLVRVFPKPEIVKIPVENHEETMEDRCQVVIQAGDIIQDLIKIEQEIANQMQTQT
jgi:hypothetical protein